MVHARHYSPLWFVLPFTTRAKILVQCLWDKTRKWGDPLLPQELLDALNDWPGELQLLRSIHVPSCNTPEEVDSANIAHEVNIFCNASERAYGAIACIRNRGQLEQDLYGKVQSYVLSMRLELSLASLRSLLEEG